MESLLNLHMEQNDVAEVDETVPASAARPAGWTH